MASRQHNAQFHKNKTLDNKYVSVPEPTASDPGGIRVLVVLILGLVSLTDCVHGGGVWGPVQMLGDEIGKGAYGRVYKGLDLENGDFVAIKQVSLENIPQEDLNIIMVRFSFWAFLMMHNVCQRKKDDVCDYVKCGCRELINGQQRPQQG
jgi:hypothetical protein